MEGTALAAGQVSVDNQVERVTEPKAYAGPWRVLFVLVDFRASRRHRYEMRKNI